MSDATRPSPPDPQDISGFADRFPMQARPPWQLYLISPPRLGADFDTRLRGVLDGAAVAEGPGRVAAFQLRVKDMEDHDLARLAEPLQKACADYDVAFIVNDSIGLAKRLGADGVHLGQGDGDPRHAREVLGRDAQIGVTCHASRHLAMEAGEAGADYVAFGAFYPTQTKAVTHYAEPSILSWWTTLFATPCVAIGGVTPDNAAPLLRAGADFLAVSGAIWNAEDPVAAARAFAKAVDRENPTPEI